MSKKVSLDDLKVGYEYEFTFKGVCRLDGHLGELYIDTPGWRYDKPELRYNVNLVELEYKPKVGDVFKGYSGTSYKIEHIMLNGDWATSFTSKTTNETSRIIRVKHQGNYTLISKD